MGFKIICHRIQTATYIKITLLFDALKRVCDFTSPKGEKKTA